jgi:hypothetical protein
MLQPLDAPSQSSKSGLKTAELITSVPVFKLLTSLLESTKPLVSILCSAIRVEEVRINHSFIPASSSWNVRWHQPWWNMFKLVDSKSPVQAAAHDGNSLQSSHPINLL